MKCRKHWSAARFAFAVRPLLFFVLFMLFFLEVFFESCVFAQRMGGSGFLPLDQPEAALDSAPRPALPDTAQKPLPPAYEPQSSELQERELLRRGIAGVELRSGRPLLLSAPFPGVLLSVLVRDGEAVDKGSIIAVFDTEAAERDVRNARQALEAAIAEVQDAGEGSGQDKTRAKEMLSKAADAVGEAEEKLAKSKFISPFAGRVTGLRVSAGQHLKRGDVLAELAEADDLEIVGTVPSQWINILEPGHVIWVYVEERGKSYEAEFVRFGGKVDAASKTIKAYARFIAVQGELLPGMSGRADFFPRPAAN